MVVVVVAVVLVVVIENSRYRSTFARRSGSMLFFLNISLHKKFHSNRMKNTDVENLRYCSVLVVRSG